MALIRISSDKASRTRTRLVTREPTRWVDWVNPMAEMDQQNEVNRAAISPIKVILQPEKKNGM